MPDYSKLTDREIDALVAERVMGHKIRWYGDQLHTVYDTQVCRNAYMIVTDAYTQDDNAARLVRNRIAELGLVKQYQSALAEQVWPIGTDQSEFHGAHSFAFRMQQATPRQQCIAALLTLDAAKEKQP